MSATEELDSFDENDFNELVESSSGNIERKNPFVVLRDQLACKEEAVKNQQVALDVKDSNLRDAEKSISDYDMRVSELEAKLRLAKSLFGT